MLYEWQGILQFVSQSGLSFDSDFFFFACSLQKQTRDKATDWLLV